MRGEPSESQQWLRPAVARLQKLLPDMPFVFSDERFTSVLAHRAMLDGALKRPTGATEPMVDRISAAIILNDYLSSLSSFSSTNP